MKDRDERLKKLELISPFSVLHAKRMRVSQRMLHYYVKKGELVRVAQGIYSTPRAYQKTFEFYLRQALLAIPQGFVGLKTALRLHDVWGTDESEIHMIVPTSNVPKRKLPHVHLYQVHSKIYKLETTTLRSIPITTLERTLVDLIRKGEALSVVFAIAKSIQQKKIELDFGKLKELSRIFRVKSKMNLLLEVLPKRQLRVP